MSIESVKKPSLRDKLYSELKVFRLVPLLWGLGAFLTAVLIYRTGKFPIGLETFKILNKSGDSIWQVTVSTSMVYLESWALYSIPRFVAVGIFLGLIVYKYGDKLKLAVENLVPILIHVGVQLVHGSMAVWVYFFLRTAILPLGWAPVLWWGVWFLLAYWEYEIVKKLLFDPVLVKGQSDLY